MVLLCSGYGIAAQALTAVVKAHDGRGPQTMLTSGIMSTLGLSSPDELIGYFPVNEYVLFYDANPSHSVSILYCIANLSLYAGSLMNPLSQYD